MIGTEWLSWGTCYLMHCDFCGEHKSNPGPYCTACMSVDSTWKLCQRDAELRGLRGERSTPGHCTDSGGPGEPPRLCMAPYAPTGNGSIYCEELADHVGDWHTAVGYTWPVKTTEDPPNATETTPADTADASARDGSKAGCEGESDRRSGTHWLRSQDEDLSWLKVRTTGSPFPLWLALPVAVCIAIALVVIGYLIASDIMQ